MINILEMVLGATIVSFTDIYALSHLLDKKINLKKLKSFIIIPLMITLTLMNYYYNNQFFRIVSVTIFMSILLKILFDEKLTKSLLGIITIQMVYMIAELAFVCALVLFNIKSENFVEMFGGKLFTNLIISLITLFFIHFKFIRKFYNILINITDKIKVKLLIGLLLIVMFAANIYAEVMYHEINFLYMMFFNVGLTLLCFFIIINSFKTKNKYIKVYDKYNTTLNSLKEYEDILDKYKVSNHENKNQLLTIRNMLSKSDDKVISYIDQIVENKLKDNEKIMFDASKIPAGGLRGLIYSKLLLMKELKITYELNISKEIKVTDLINLDDSLLLDICKIIGVYIDNSIQEVKKLRKKYILIELYIDNKDLIIKIANNYKGTIELDKIDLKGYTTKEGGHGYGLTLAKQIIDNNPKLVNEKEITKEIFTQILKIKM